MKISYWFSPQLMILFLFQPTILHGAVAETGSNATTTTIQWGTLAELKNEGITVVDLGKIKKNQSLSIPLGQARSKVCKNIYSLSPSKGPHAGKNINFLINVENSSQVISCYRNTDGTQTWHELSSFTLKECSGVAKLDALNLTLLPDGIARINAKNNKNKELILDLAF